MNEGIGRFDCFADLLLSTRRDFLVSRDHWPAILVAHQGAGNYAHLLRIHQPFVACGSEVVKSEGCHTSAGAFEFKTEFKTTFGRLQPVGGRSRTDRGSVDSYESLNLPKAHLLDTVEIRPHLPCSVPLGTQSGPFGHFWTLSCTPQAALHEPVRR
jgi:hypothetical protein